MTMEEVASSFFCGGSIFIAILDSDKTLGHNNIRMIQFCDDLRCWPLKTISKISIKVVLKFLK